MQIRRATVLYDADCGFCTRSKQLAERLDWLRLLHWQPGGPELDAIWLVTPSGRRYSGYRAWKRIAARLPVYWLSALPAALLHPALPLLWLFALTPLANPPGEALYRWVARHRHRLASAKACAPALKGDSPGRSR